MASDREARECAESSYGQTQKPTLRENGPIRAMPKPIAIESASRAMEALQMENARLSDQINDRDNRIEHLENELRAIRNMSDEIIKRYTPAAASSGTAGSGVAGRAF